MGKKNKQNKDQKRKKQLAERKSRQRTPAVEPYEGKKYQAEEFVPLMTVTEVAIQEADMITEQTLTDRQVMQSLEYLVLRLRGGHPPLPKDSPRTTKDEEELDLVSSNIVDRWESSKEIQEGHYSADDRIGVLRTLLNSIPTRTRMHGGSRGYLKFVARFLADMGLGAKRISVEEASRLGMLPEPEQDEPEEE